MSAGRLREEYRKKEVNFGAWRKEGIKQNVQVGRWTVFQWRRSGSSQLDMLFLFVLPCSLLLFASPSDASAIWW